MISKLDWMREQHNAQAEPWSEWWSYRNKHHLDLATVLPHCGTLAVTFCTAIETANGQFVFEFNPSGVLSVVIEAQVIRVVEGLNEFVIQDLVAWEIGAPDYFATAMGPGAGMALLGPVAAFRELSDNTPIHLCRNPETWLINGCQGSVALKPEAALWLTKPQVPLICENIEHARELSRLLGSSAKKCDIFIPDDRRAA